MKKMSHICGLFISIFTFVNTSVMAEEVQRPDESQFEYAKSKKFLGTSIIRNTPEVKETGIWEATFTDKNGKETGPWVIQTYEDGPGKFNLLPRGRNIFSLSKDGKDKSTECPNTDNPLYSFNASTNKTEKFTAFCGTMRPRLFPELIKGYTRKTIEKVEAGKIVDCAVYYSKNSEDQKEEALNQSTNWYNHETSRCVSCQEQQGPGCPDFQYRACPNQTDKVIDLMSDGYNDGKIAFLKYKIKPSSEVVTIGPFLILYRQGTVSVPSTGFFTKIINLYQLDCFKNFFQPQKIFNSGSCKGVPHFTVAPDSEVTTASENSEPVYSVEFNGQVFSTPVQLSPDLCPSYVYTAKGVSQEVLTGIINKPLNPDISSVVIIDGSSENTGK